MKAEIEATFYDVDPERIRAKLIDLGATKVRDLFLMRRVTFSVPDRDIHHWLRVRDEGDKISVAYKHQAEEGLSGTKEAQINVENFNEAVELFENLGFQKLRYEENKRETWKVGEVEVVIDFWPHIAPCCEAEGLTEEAVKEAISLLGFDMRDAMFGGAGNLYQLVYGKEDDEWVLDKTKTLTFDQENPFV